MDTKTYIRTRFYDTTLERESRFEISVRDFKEALENSDIKIHGAVRIEQVWFGSSSQFTARIRKTKSIFGEFAMGTIGYEHTVKHHLTPTTDYEISTTISQKDYDVLFNLYNKLGVQSKSRLYINNTDGTLCDYIITVDILDDKPNICYVEFEMKNPLASNSMPFEKPKWVK